MRRYGSKAALVLVLIICFSACLTACFGGRVREDETGPAELNVPDPSAVAAFPFEFSAYDVNGVAVSHGDIGEKEVFFIYLWSTT